MVIVSGRISTRSWEGQDGRKNYTTEVVANEINFGETKKARQEYQGGYQQAPQQSAPARSSQQYAAPAPAQSMPEGLEDEEFIPMSEIDDDLPF